MSSIQDVRNLKCSWCRSEFQDACQVAAHLDRTHPYTITNHGRTTADRICAISAESAAQNSGGLHLGDKLHVENVHTRQVEVFWVQAQLHRAGGD